MQESTQRFSFAVITLSDKGARGEREDESGKLLQDLLKAAGYELRAYKIIPDSIPEIVGTVRDLIDNKQIDLIVTTGGTGVAPTDVTPEAMQEILEKDIPGMAEAMRAASLKKTPHAVLSRARVGIRRESLVINLPGSKKAAQENIEALLKALPHALEKIKGDTGDCGK